VSGAFTEISAADLAERMLAAAAEGRPASFIRFNDGEARITGREDYFPADKIAQQIRRFFGDNLLTSDQLRQLGDRVLDAVRGADVVGLPPADWPRDFACARDIVRNAVGGATLVTAHVDFHQHLFSSRFFAKIFALDKKVALITCRDVESYVRDVYLARDPGVYLVPEQADGSYDGAITPHYPQYCDWLCSVLSRVAPGTVCLVGAGICGKIYCEAIRRAGSIAIDIGSIFDLWAGRFSRPYMETDGIRDYYLRRLARLDIEPAVIRAAAEIYRKEGDNLAALRVINLGRRKYPLIAEFFHRSIELLLQLEVAEAVVAIRTLLFQLRPEDIFICARLTKRNGQAELAASLLLACFRRQPLFPKNLAELCGSMIAQTASVSSAERMQIIEACRVAAASAEPYQPLLFQFARLLGNDGDIQGAAALGTRAIALDPLDVDCLDHQIQWLRALQRHEEADGLGQRREQLRTSAYAPAK